MKEINSYLIHWSKFQVKSEFTLHAAANNKSEGNQIKVEFQTLNLQIMRASVMTKYLTKAKLKKNYLFRVRRRVKVFPTWSWRYFNFFFSCLSSYSLSPNMISTTLVFLSLLTFIWIRLPALFFTLCYKYAASITYVHISQAIY